VTVRIKIIAMVVGVSAFAAGLTSVVNYQVARSALEERGFAGLIAAREMKGEQVESYFQLISAQLYVEAQDSSTARRMTELATAAAAEPSEEPDPTESERRLRRYYQDLLRRMTDAGASASMDAFYPRASAALRLQRAYIGDNEFKAGSKHLLDEADGATAYDEAHRRHHPHFRTFVERYGFYDAFLIEPERGQIVWRSTSGPPCAMGPIARAVWPASSSRSSRLRRRPARSVGRTSRPTRRPTSRQRPSWPRRSSTTGSWSGSSRCSSRSSVSTG
jgi:methyl-accepting chemotaxis protein